MAIEKKILSLLFLFVLFIGVVACNKDVAKEEVAKKADIEKFVKDYSTERYTVKDPSNPPSSDEIANKIKEYLSKDEYDAQIANRYYSIPSMVAKEVNKSIEVQNLNLEEQSENDDSTIDYKYTIKFKLYDEESSKVYDKEGELTISTKDNELKITRDWSRGVKIDGLEQGGL
ncbi:hypothetical protein ACQKMY_25105 [Peribacillus frigoritolerans]|uniref:hypothetical protein n=1 Tax=Peribacillus frigoritolerans TaxID=450367 RepID=UPI003D0472FB